MDAARERRTQRASHRGRHATGQPGGSPDDDTSENSRHSPTPLAAGSASVADKPRSVSQRTRATAGAAGGSENGRGEEPQRAPAASLGGVSANGNVGAGPRAGGAGAGAGANADSTADFQDHQRAHPATRREGVAVSA